MSVKIQVQVIVKVFVLDCCQIPKLNETPNSTLLLGNVYFKLIASFFFFFISWVLPKTVGVITRSALR